MTSLAVLAAAEGGNGFWLPADFNEVIWNSTAFFIVVFLLWKFTGKTVAAAFTKRSKAVSDELDAAAEVRVAAETERDRVRDALAGAEDEAAAIIAEARIAADQLRVDTEVRTAADVERIHTQAAAELAEMRARAASDLQGELARLSFGAAEEVVANSIDDTAQQRLIDDYINRVNQQN